MIIGVMVYLNNSILKMYKYYIIVISLSKEPKLLPVIQDLILCYLLYFADKMISK